MTGLVKGVGCISLGMGVFLILLPKTSPKLLGWEEYENTARIVGVVDLILGSGLLFDKSKSRWMLARSLLNVVILATYLRVLISERPPRGRVVGGLAAMSGPTVIDYLLWRRLRED